MPGHQLYPTAQPESLRALVGTHGNELFSRLVGHDLDGLPSVNVREVLPSGSRWPEGGVNMQYAYPLRHNLDVEIPAGQGTKPEVVDAQKRLAGQIIEEGKEHNLVVDLHSPIETAFTTGFIAVHEQALQNPKILRLLNALGELTTHIIVDDFGILPESEDSRGNLNSVVVELDPRNPKHQPGKVREVIARLMVGDDDAITGAFGPSRFSWYRSRVNITRAQALQHGLAGHDVQPAADLPVELAREFGHEKLIAMAVPDIATDDPQRPFWGEAAAPLDLAVVHDLLSGNKRRWGY